MEENGIERGKERRIRMREGKIVTVERKRRESIRRGRYRDEKRRGKKRKRGKVW